MIESTGISTAGLKQLRFNWTFDCPVDSPVDLTINQESSRK